MSGEEHTQGSPQEPTEPAAPAAPPVHTPPRRPARPPATFWNWLRNTARLWGFLGFILIVLIIFRAVVLPFILAVLVTYVLSPVLNFLCGLRVARRTCPRWLWVIGLYLVLFGLIALFTTSFVPRVSADLKRVVREAPAFWDQARREWMPRAAAWVQANFAGEQAAKPPPATPPAKPRRQTPRLQLKKLPDGSFELDARGLAVDVVQQGEGRWTLRAATRNARPVDHSLEGRINRHIEDLIKTSERGFEQVVRLGQKALLGLLSALTTFILTLMISAFLLIDSQRILGGLRGLVAQRFHEDFDNVVRLIDRGLSGAIRGQLLICIVNGILTFIGLKLIGVKYSMLLAVLAAVMSLIPIFGSILSSIPIVLVALTSGGAGIDLVRGVLILAWIIGIHLVEANLLNPKIIGSAARIHPVVVIFAVVAGERTYGAFGALLAVPLVSAIQAVFLYVRRRVQAGEQQAQP